MAVELHEESDGKVLLVNLSGKLVAEDYSRFGPRVESLVKTHGKVRMLVRMHDFHGWSMGALWEDIKFDLRHFADIERLALVGDRKWEAGMAVFCKPFTTAAVRYFNEAEIASALAWVHDGIWPPGQEPTKLGEFKVLDESADSVTLEEWQEWVAPGKPGRTVFRLPTGLHVKKSPGVVGQYDVILTGEKLRMIDPAAS